MRVVLSPGESPVQAKVLATRKELSEALVERDGEVDLVLCAMVAQEHPLLVGPPGCAKSLLLDALARWMEGKAFTALLTKFSQMEDLFGPVSLQALREDRYVRVTAGRLPEADLAFLDEVFRGSAAVLNCLLKVLNERVFDNGGGAPVRVPLKVCLGAANEWPSPFEGGKELAAAFDRFLLRKEVRPVATLAGRQRLLWRRDHTPSLSTTITPAELDRARAEALALPWAGDAKEALEEVLRQLAREGVRPGDRRQHKAVGAAQAYAYLAGDDRVLPEHLEVLQHVLWDDPQEQPRKCAQVIARVANPAGMRVSQLLLECEQLVEATDVKNLSQAATATAKLGEIDRQLAALRADGRVERARAYVKEVIRKVKVASLEAV